MTDLWQVLGQMLTDANLKTNLYTLPGQYYPVDQAQQRLIIPEDCYTTARGIINATIPSPISLMALGELLMVLSSQEFRARADGLFQAVQATGVPAAGRSPLFYCGLGLMFLDDTIAETFANGGFQQVQFGSLSADEQGAINQLANAQPVRDASTYMCDLFWSEGCFDKYQFYTGHEHPLAQPLPVQ